MVPRIGIAPRFVSIHGIERSIQTHRLFLSFSKFPVELIPLMEESICLPDIISSCDGFILPGGGDFSIPSKHSLTPPNRRGVDERHDLFDQLLIDYSVINKVPLLGICRGMQALNLFLGGTLLEDLNEKTILHDGQRHDLNVKGSSAFSSTLSTNSQVFSSHHQAIDQVAPLFQVSATWGGVIEAIEHPYLPLFGVQWHPEVDVFSTSTDDLFRFFAEMVYQYSLKKEIKKE